MKERRYDVDWLRVIAMLAVFIFHCSRFFDTEGWHLKNAEQSSVVFVLSLGAKYLNFNHKILAYGNEAVLPLYLFHQTIILIVGFFVIRWNMGILPKFLIITMISFPLVLVLYELLVRPFNVVRFFFGMRPRKQPTEELAVVQVLEVNYECLGGLLLQVRQHAKSRRSNR